VSRVEEGRDGSEVDMGGEGWIRVEGLRVKGLRFNG